MNSIDRIHMNKFLRTLELRVNQAQGSDPALLVRLTEVKKALYDIGDLYPDDSTLTENLGWIDRLVETMERKSEEGKQ